MERRVLGAIATIYCSDDALRLFILTTIEYLIRGMIPCYGSDNFLSLERGATLLSSCSTTHSRPRATARRVQTQQSCTRSIC